MTNNLPKNHFESFDLIYFIFAKRKILFFLTAIGAVSSVIVSLLITERYKSIVILYPASSTSVSQSLLSDRITEKDILKFGEEEEVEQILQILYSDDIRTTVVKRFNLLKHYDIDTASAFPMTELEQEFSDNIKFNRTEYQSIEISVLDKDAQLASDIANAISDLVDSSMTKVKRERAQKALKLVENEYFSLKSQMQLLEDSLTKIRNLGINDYEKQAQSYSDAYAAGIIKGSNNLKLLEDKLKILSTYGGAYVSIRDLLVYQTERISILESKYREAKVDVEQNLPCKYIVNHAYKAEKKSYPVRWLIVTVSTISTFILTLLALIAYDAVIQSINKVGNEKN